MAKVEQQVVKELPSGFEITHESGSLSVHELAPGVILQEYERGVIDEYFEPVAELGERRIREGLRVTLVSDISRSRSHTTSYRRAWSTWISDHADDIDEVLVLLNSPMQRMAVNAANVATGGVFRAFTDVEQFQAAVEAAVLRAEVAAEKVPVLSPVRPRGGDQEASTEPGGETGAEPEAAAADGAPRVATVRLHTTFDDDSHSLDADGPSAASRSIAAQPTIGTVLGGNYRLDQRIGKGGMGMVYRGTQLSLERDVAIKLIRLDRRHSPEAFARFRREIDLISHLSHPNIVQVIDAGATEAGVTYLVMELLEGQRLDRVVSRPGLEIGAVEELFRQLCAGVRAAHAEGLIHRDLSPANVFVGERKDGSHQVKILDFGLAKATHGSDHGLTLDGQILGTPGFMAPEQIEHGGAVDERSDVYSLGAVLFFMLTGSRPFVGKSAAATIAAQLRGEYAPLPAEHACFGPLLDRVLALEPDARPRDVAALWSDFEVARAGAPDPLALDPALARHVARPRGGLRPLVPWLLVGAAVMVTASVLALQSCEVEARVEAAPGTEFHGEKSHP